jgi:hypothetical protein
MSTTSKTPWIIRNSPESLLRIQSDLVYNRRYTIVNILNPSKLDHENFKRIVACVNALHGIEDVEQFVQDAKTLMGQNGKI